LYFVHIILSLILQFMIILLILFLYLVQVTHPDFKKAKDKVMFKKKEGVPEGLYM
jgi:hypothetical protein